MTPKVFVSYSWTNQAHREFVRHLADRLLADGIDVVLDVYDLQEGQDKYVFMERMVTDDSVTHVLVFSDKEYTEKAKGRKHGVGTESQIISQEVYEQVNQSKFVPIVCEFDDSGEPYLPVFLETRVWIDFSTEQKINEHWEQLTRLIYNKPQFMKPRIGKAPSYITSDVPVPAIGSSARFNSLKQAILQDKRGLATYRHDFLDSCLSYADELRVRERPNLEAMGEKVLEDCNNLKLVRDPLVNWVLLEGESTPEDEFSEILIEFLEKLRELKSRPPEITSWNNSWFEAHSVFVYGVFLYFVAALLKTKSHRVLNRIYTAHYLIPETDRRGDRQFERFSAFYGYSKTLQSVLAPEGQRLHAPAAELLNRHADRPDIPFPDIIQAELLTLLMSLITSNTYWYPQTLYYSPHGARFPFFVRAAQREHFRKLAVVTGIEDAEVLRSTIREGSAQRGTESWQHSGIIGMPSYLSLMSADKWDTLG